MAKNVIDDGAAFSRANKTRVTITGTYVAVPSPRKGPPARDEPRDHALVELPDGTKIYLEAFGTPAAVRPAAETERFDARTVLVTGTAWRIMPSPGAAPLAPCLTDVTDLSFG